MSLIAQFEERLERAVEGFFARIFRSGVHPVEIGKRLQRVMEDGKTVLWKAELKEGRRKLFPIRLVDFETIRDWECFDADRGKDLGVEIREFFIPDFSNWKDHDSFEAAFARLLKDLKTATAANEKAT